MTSNYDLSYVPDYLSRKMFLDGAVTIQRFEECAYPKIQNYEKLARGFFWVPEEISLTQDKIDHKTASEAMKFVFTQNLLRQTALDSIQGRAPSQIFTPVISVPELEALVNNWSFFETNIHSNSYSHIIRNIYNVPKDQFNSIHDTSEIISMASSVGDYYNRLHRINCMKELYPERVSEEDHVDAIWLALNASYALEAMRFMVSFATSLGMVENKVYMGNGAIISLILQDELLHTEWTAYIINQVVKNDPRFVEAKKRLENEVYQMYLDVITEEKAWADHLFSKGVVVGLNADILKKFVDYTATHRLKDIGIKYTENPVKTNPIPWFNKHTNTSSKQTALQEQESTSYVIGVMSSEVDHEELPDLSIPVAKYAPESSFNPKREYKPETKPIDVVLYSSPSCGFCTKAKQVFEDRMIYYTEIDAPSHKEEMQKRVFEATGQVPVKVPQIFIDGEYIGGYTELYQLVTSGDDRFSLRKK